MDGLLALSCLFKKGRIRRCAISCPHVTSSSVILCRSQRVARGSEVGLRGRSYERSARLLSLIPIIRLNEFFLMGSGSSPVMKLEAR